MCGYGDTDFTYESDRQEAVGCAVLEENLEIRPETKKQGNHPKAMDMDTFSIEQ